MKKTLVALVCLSLVAPAFAKSRGFSSPSRSYSSPSRSFSTPAPKPAAPAPAPKPVTPPPAVAPSKPAAPAPQPVKSPPVAAPAAPTKSAQLAPTPAATQPTTVYREREVVHESSSGGFFSTATGVVGGMMFYNWLFGSKEAAAAPAPQTQPTDAAKSPANSECVRSPATNECVPQK